VELLFPLTLREDMKDVFIHPRGLGLRGVWMVRKTSPVHVFILSDLHISVNPFCGIASNINLSITNQLSK